MSDEDRIVYSWPRGRDEEVRATLSEFKGRLYAHVRVYVADDADEMHPTRKGIAVRVEDLPHLSAAVDALLEAAGFGEVEAA